MRLCTVHSSQGLTKSLEKVITAAYVKPSYCTLSASKQPRGTHSVGAPMAHSITSTVAIDCKRPSQPTRYFTIFPNLILVTWVLSPLSRDSSVTPCLGYLKTYLRHSTNLKQNMVALSTPLTDGNINTCLRRSFTVKSSNPSHVLISPISH